MSCIINASTSNGLINQADTSGTINIQSNGTTVLTAGATGVIIPAGTTTIAPLQLTSGTNLTTATAGALEFNGYSPYFTPTSTQRGVVQAAQYYALNSTVAGANTTGVQNWLGVGVTLASSTQYEFEGFLYLVKSAGTTSHTVSIGFGGTATLNNISYQDVWSSSMNGTASLVTTASQTVATGSFTSASQTVFLAAKGIVSVNAGGTFIPQYSLSAAPGGAYTTQIGSYFKIAPLAASGSNISIGTWA